MSDFLQALTYVQTENVSCGQINKPFFKQNVTFMTRAFLFPTTTWQRQEWIKTSQWRTRKTSKLFNMWVKGVHANVWKHIVSLFLNSKTSSHYSSPLSSSSFGENSLVKNTKSVLNVKNDTSSGLCVHRGGFIPLKDQVWSLYALAKQQ